MVILTMQKTYLATFLAFVPHLEPRNSSGTDACVTSNKRQTLPEMLIYSKAKKSKEVHHGKFCAIFTIHALNLQALPALTKNQKKGFVTPVLVCDGSTTFSWGYYHVVIMCLHWFDFYQVTTDILILFTLVDSLTSVEYTIWDPHWYLFFNGTRVTSHLTHYQWATTDFSNKSIPPTPLLLTHTQAHDRET